MAMCVSRPQADSFTGHAKNVTFLQLTDMMNPKKGFWAIKITKLTAGAKRFRDPREGLP